MTSMNYFLHQFQLVL